METIGKIAHYWPVGDESAFANPLADVKFGN